ncbi:hypothetical protein [uncultured Thioclava sp.]|uniref:hypothetical protein n=1 Tax=uncultured Thioclava sp. TaxID=473858 RepID=UPI0025E2B87D|nr:hypothetical protein [uncultured Thioclava sp.]
MKKLPSLHIPVLALAGLLAGLGLWYALALMNALWVLVVVGIVLILVLEAMARVTQALMARVGARGEGPSPHMPHLRGRERYVAVAGLVVGLVCGYAFWGPVLIWGQGGGA